MKLAQGPRDMSKIARLAATKGGKTRAILKLAGRSAIALTVGAFNLANWMLWAIVTAFGLVSALKRMTERATERSCARRRLRRARQRAGARAGATARTRAWFDRADHGETDRDRFSLRRPWCLTWCRRRRRSEALRRSGRSRAAAIPFPRAASGGARNS
jgi:hypothetical protein